MIFKKEYIVQWKHEQIRMWWEEYRTNKKNKALKYMYKMLKRSENMASWRIVERNKKNDKHVVVFETNISRRDIINNNIESCLYDS